MIFPKGQSQDPQYDLKYFSFSICHLHTLPTSDPCSKILNEDLIIPTLACVPYLVLPDLAQQIGVPRPEKLFCSREILPMIIQIFPKPTFLCVSLYSLHAIIPIISKTTLIQIRSLQLHTYQTICLRYSFLAFSGLGRSSEMLLNPRSLQLTVKPRSLMCKLQVHPVGHMMGMGGLVW